MRSNPSGDSGGESLPADGTAGAEEATVEGRRPTVAELRVPAADLALATAFERRPELTVRVEPVAASRPDSPFGFAWVDADAVDALRADRTVVVDDVLTRCGEEALCDLAFRGRVSPAVDAVTENGGTILAARASDDGWTLRVRYPERGALADTVSAFERLDVTVDLVGIGHRPESLGADLTPKQRETVATAFERGYFEIPREVSLADLAADLDVTHQALSERLRRAEQALLRAEFGERD
jgi:predicted DNA binding protein